MLCNYMYSTTRYGKNKTSITVFLYYYSNRGQAGEEKLYKNGFDALVKIAKKDGFFGLYQGYFLSLLIVILVLSYVKYYIQLHV